jgi:hypothetical protein
MPPIFKTRRLFTENLLVPPWTRHPVRMKTTAAVRPIMSQVLRVAAALMVLAAVLAAPGAAQDVTTTETTTTTTFETTTAPATTMVETQTVEHTTTTVETTEATTSANEQSGGTPTWVWVLVGALAVGLVAALVGLLSGRRGPPGVPLEQRQRQLRGAVNSWVAQGWAVESESADSAVLRRGNERMLITVDAAGQLGSRPLS